MNIQIPIPEFEGYEVKGLLRVALVNHPPTP